MSDLRCGFCDLDLNEEEGKMGLRGLRNGEREGETG